jgi:hypothetical protein
MSKAKGSWWVCPMCSRRMKAYSAYHFKTCKGPVPT